MRRKACGVVAGYCTVLMWMAGCNGNSYAKSDRWNEETSTFSIDEENVGYTLPTDVALWALADQEGLPPTVDFLGIDTLEEVCVVIFRPSVPLNGSRSSTGYSREEVENTVKEISSPHPGQKIVDENLENRQLTDSLGRSWHFSLGRTIVDLSQPTDTFAINYSGFLFDGKTRPFGLVVISPLHPSDSIGGLIFEKYVSGLKSMN